jgi:pimeloyl-ACP methyl ester carboxylesterase
MSTAVVYVHGLWLSGWESAWLRARVARRLGAHTRTFSYRSVRGTIDEHAAGLARFLASLPADTVHLIGHSMGGIVILECFERPESRAFAPGRIVIMGSPVRGSQAAHRLARFRLGPQLLGLTAREVLLAPREYTWNGARELGVMAGNLPLGFGRLMGRLPQASDGTVMVAETVLPGATAHITVPVSHSGFLISAAVARQASAFLRDGRFETRG